MASVQTNQITHTYVGEKAMRKGIARMAQQGYRVVSQSSYQPRAGVGRIVLLGFFALLFKPPIKFTVTYERDASK